MPRASAPDISKSVQTETSAISSVVEVMKGINALAQAQESLVQQRVDALAIDNEGLEVGNEWIPIIQQVLPYVGPYLPALIEKFTGVKPSLPPADLPPSSPPPEESEAAGGLTAKQLIEMAAEHSPTEIAVALNLKGYKELEKQGIDRKTFKKAIANINKAV